MENTIKDKRGYESDPTDKTDQDLERAPLSDPFSQGGNWIRKTVNRREGEPYFKPLGRKPLFDTTHTVTFDNGHVLRKSEIAFKKTQPLAHSKFFSIPNSILSIYDLAGKRKRNSSSKRRDTNETGPSPTYLPTRATGTKNSKPKTPSIKGSKFVYPDIDSSLDLRPKEYRPHIH